MGTGLVDGQEGARKKEDEALWSLHKQQFHLPLLDAGQQLEARLCELADIYRGNTQHTPESLSGDFRELYLLSRDEIPSILDSDGNQPRRDDDAVQRVRKRMCYELTFATSSLYWTARYLAYARLAHLSPQRRWVDAWTRPIGRAWTS